MTPNTNTDRPKAKRYILMQDDSSHWYVVPVERIREFDAWTSQDKDWETPTYAHPIGGAPSAVTFIMPEIFDVPVSEDKS